MKTALIAFGILVALAIAFAPSGADLDESRSEAEAADSVRLSPRKSTEEFRRPNGRVV